MCVGLHPPGIAVTDLCLLIEICRLNGQGGNMLHGRHEPSRPALPLSGAATAPRPHATAQVMSTHDAHLLDQEAETRADTFVQGALRDQHPRDGTPKAS
jgi:hypothetical protein